MLHCHCPPLLLLHCPSWGPCYQPLFPLEISSPDLLQAVLVPWFNLSLSIISLELPWSRNGKQCFGLALYSLLFDSTPTIPTTQHSLCPYLFVVHELGCELYEYRHLLWTFTDVPQCREEYELSLELNTFWLNECTKAYMFFFTSHKSLRPSFLLLQHFLLLSMDSYFIAVLD